MKVLSTNDELTLINYLKMSRENSVYCKVHKLSRFSYTYCGGV